MKKLLLLAALTSCSYSANQLSTGAIDAMNNDKAIQMYSGGDKIELALKNHLKMELTKERLGHKKNNKTLLQALQEIKGSPVSNTKRYQEILNELDEYRAPAPVNYFKLEEENLLAINGLTNQGVFQIEAPQQQETAADKLKAYISQTYNGKPILLLRDTDEQIIMFIHLQEATEAEYNIRNLDPKVADKLATLGIAIGANGKIELIPENHGE